jgi:hypothetical protein
MMMHAAVARDRVQVVMPRSGHIPTFREMRQHLFALPPFHATTPAALLESVSGRFDCIPHTPMVLNTAYTTTAQRLHEAHVLQARDSTKDWMPSA